MVLFFFWFLQPSSWFTKYSFFLGQSITARMSIEWITLSFILSSSIIFQTNSICLQSQCVLCNYYMFDATVSIGLVTFGVDCLISFPFYSYLAALDRFVFDVSNTNITTLTFFFFCFEQTVRQH